MNDSAIFIGFDFGVPPVVIVYQFKDGVVTVLNEGYGAFNKQDYYEEICTNMRKRSPDRFSIADDLINTYEQAIKQMNKEKYMWESLGEELQYFKSMANSLRCAGHQTAEKLEKNQSLRGKLEAAEKEIEIIRKDNTLLRQEREILRGVHDRKKENEGLKKEIGALNTHVEGLICQLNNLAEGNRNIKEENEKLKFRGFTVLETENASLKKENEKLSKENARIKDIDFTVVKEMERLKKKVNRLLSKFKDINETYMPREHAEQMRDDLAVEKQEVGTYKILLERATKERDSVIKTIHSLHEGHLKEIKHYEEMRAEYQECWNELKRWHFNCSDGKLKDNYGNSYLLGHHFKPSSKFIKE